jgi:hypothetical protein
MPDGFGCGIGTRNDTRERSLMSAGDSTNQEHDHSTSLSAVLLVCSQARNPTD